MTARCFPICAVAIFAVACSHERPVETRETPAPPAAASVAAGAQPVETEMRHVLLHVAPNVILDIDQLNGTMRSRAKGTPPVFDDGRSYVLEVSCANLSMSLRSLESLMNDFLLSDEDSPLREVRLEADDERLDMKGKLHKGITVPISAKTSIGVSDDGRLKMDVDSMKAIGIPVSGLLDLLGLDAEDLMNLEQTGVQMVGNSILITPGLILPPPEIRGRLTEAKLAGGRLVQRFGTRRSPSAAKSLPAPDAKNYVYFAGGDLRFGKLTMSDADLQLIDLDPADPFDFYPARYKTQLVAGYSRNTESGALKTYMPDFGDLEKGARDLAPGAGERGSQPPAPSPKRPAN